MRSPTVGSLRLGSGSTNNWTKNSCSTPNGRLSNKSKKVMLVNKKCLDSPYGNERSYSKYVLEQHVQKLLRICKEVVSLAWHVHKRIYSYGPFSFSLTPSILPSSSSLFLIIITDSYLTTPFLNNVHTCNQI